MAKTKVAILGGGISSLTAAYYLSRTPELRARYDITVHQLGWRLGGKLASARESQYGMRNVEHGLHVWFGFYDNAFNLFQEVFARWPKPEACPYRVWKDAFTPRSYTPIGEWADGRLTYWKVMFPENSEEPGGEQVLLTPEGVISEIINIIEMLLKRLWGEEDWGEKPEERPSLFDIIDELVDDVMATPLKMIGAAAKLAAKLDDLDGAQDRYKAIRWFLLQFQKLVLPMIAKDLDPDTDENHLYNTMVFATAVTLALLNPEYGIEEDWNLDRVDHLEFRQLLLANGADPKVVADWGVIKALYDAWFEYKDGDLKQPDFAAGTALRVMIRIGFTFKGSVLWLVNAGMGETVIGPLYEVLLQQGVKFEFFHKLKSLRLDAGGRQVQSLIFEQQATCKGEAPYRPTFRFGGLTCWPPHPDYAQLEQGEELERRQIDLESHWTPWTGPYSVNLELGRDFDAVVLGICAGVYARWNDEPSICQDLIDRVPAFRRFTEAIGLVPSTGVQLWVTKNLEQLGFEGGPPAMVHGSYPNDVWADMTQTLAHEDWPKDDKPAGVHYLCGTLGTRLYQRPAREHQVPAEAQRLVYEATLRQLQDPVQGLASVWPRALTLGQFDWGVLYDPKGGKGEARLAAQFLRANVDPTECCVGTATGTTATRLAGNEFGVDNLYLAGEAARTGMNSSCVEGAVMAGMHAAKALSGEALVIVGNDFMRGGKS